MLSVLRARQAADGAKTITIAVTDDQDATIVYETTTNAQYLRQAMEDTKDLTFQGTEGQYGLMLDTINGLTAELGKRPSLVEHLCQRCAGQLRN